MEFKKLYQRNTNGSVQEWQIFVEGDKYFSRSGKSGGKIVESAKTSCDGKNTGKANQTTPEEQSLLEAASKHKKKLESGYSETLEGIDNTGLLEPQLAKEYKDHFHKMKFPVISSSKLDGIRVNALESGLYSRSGKPFVSIPHIHKALSYFYTKYPEYVLDGEIYSSDLASEFNKIISLVRKTKPTWDDIQESEKSVQFWVFDIFRKDGKEELDSYDRKSLVRQIVREINSPYIIDLEFTICGNQEDLDKMYGKYLANGVEGQMINSYTALYQHKRSADLLKRKEFQDAEFKILDVISGVGNREGCGILVLESVTGKSFQCSIKGDIEYMRKVFSERKQYIGRPATVKFQNYTPGTDMIPRFPVCTQIARETYE